MVGTTIKQRIIAFIEYKNISIRRFCELISVSPAYINNIKKSIPSDKVATIVKYFPDLNTGWLLTGTGEMLNELVVKTADCAPDTSLLLAALAAKEAENVMLKDKIIELQDRLLNVDTNKYKI